MQPSSSVTASSVVIAEVFFVAGVGGRSVVAHIPTVAIGLREVWQTANNSNMR
jgi:hypothetical protein